MSEVKSQNAVTGEGSAFPGDRIDAGTRGLIAELAGGQERLSFPMQRSAPFDPPAAYGVLRSRCPAAPAMLHGKNAWLISRYDDVRQALSDPALSSDMLHPDFPLNDAMRASVAARGRNAGSFLKMDPPEHDEMRRMVTRDFTVKQVEALRPRIQVLVDELIDDMVAGPQPADLFEVLATPMPNTVICWLLGVPQSDHAFFQDRTTYFFKRDVPADVRMEKAMDLIKYMYGLVDERINDPNLSPDTDIISRLVHDQYRAGKLDRDQVHSIAFLMLVAGHETTGNMAALGVCALLAHPEQYRELGQNPSLAPRAVEELMRYLTINNDPNSRVAKADTVIAGQHIKAGESVMPLTFSANRDEGHYDNPNVLDIHRSVRDHLGFGFGIHQCLGQPLARVELQVFYATLARRIPTLQLATPLHDIDFKTDTEIYGVNSLPVTW